MSDHASSDADDRHHQYCWGEPSARGFAQACRKRLGGLVVVLTVDVDAAVDITEVVSR